MTDPVIEAAQRAWDSPYWNTYTACSEGSLAVAAAREALKPIQEWYDKWLYELSIRGLDEASDELAALIFTTEELER